MQKKKNVQPKSSVALTFTAVTVLKLASRGNTTTLYNQSIRITDLERKYSCRDPHRSATYYKSSKPLLTNAIFFFAAELPRSQDRSLDEPGGEGPSISSSRTEVVRRRDTLTVPHDARNSAMRVFLETPRRFERNFTYTTTLLRTLSEMVLATTDSKTSVFPTQPPLRAHAPNDEKTGEHNFNTVPYVTL